MTWIVRLGLSLVGIGINILSFFVVIALKKGHCFKLLTRYFVPFILLSTCVLLLHRYLSYEALI
jgi:hypothetical protein